MTDQKPLRDLMAELQNKWHPPKRVTKSQPPPKPKKTLPTHSTCPYCKRQEPIPPYAYAHWKDLLNVQCINCGRHFHFIGGKTKRIPKVSKKL